jgi:ubiquinone/menaquinone biosynthesis C-methylase UbiE
MATDRSAENLKQRVGSFWDSEPCGARDLPSPEAYEEQALSRYAMEPHIPGFAQFAASRGLKVLEVGVGMGADYFEWLKAGAIATGVDLTAAAVERTRARCELAGYEADVLQADAENLPFAADSFDVVYSYGVMHHSPDTQRCIREAFRVLKPGGRIRIMLYHHPSLTGLMLWLRYGLFRGQSIREAVYRHLESPGTKCFSKTEIRSMMKGFEHLSIQVAFSPGDLLLNQPSVRFRFPVYRLIWKLYPRRPMRSLGRRLGLCLLVSAAKPVVPT